MHDKPAPEEREKEKKEEEDRHGEGRSPIGRQQDRGRARLGVWRRDGKTMCVTRREWPAEKAERKGGRSERVTWERIGDKRRMGECLVLPL